MNIEELHVKGFGKWRDVTFRFAPGINLFAAPNESGKSTLLQAIFASLYGMKRDYVKTTRYLPEYEKYRPWHQAEYETVITYQLSGKTYRLHRTLQKEREQARIFLLPDWTELTDVYQEDRRKERDFVERHLGLTRSLFTDVTWIKREPLASGEHLLPVLQGSGEAEEATPVVRQILEELERETGAIGVKERAENTLLGKAASLAAQKEQELLQAQAAWSEVSQLTRQIAVWEQEKSAEEQRKKRVQRKKQQALEREAVWRERWQQSYVDPDEQGWEWWETTALSPKELSIHKQAREELARVTAGKNEELSDWKDQHHLHSEWEQISADYQRGLELRRERETAHQQLVLSSASETLPDVGGRRQRVQQRRSYAPWLWIAAWLFTGMSATSWLFQEWTNGAVLFAVAVLSALLAVIASRKPLGSGQSRRKPSEWQQWQQEAERLDAAIAQLLQKWGAKDWESFLEVRDAMRDQLHAVALQQSSTQVGRQEETAAIVRKWAEGVREFLLEEQQEWQQELQNCQEEELQIEQKLQQLREQIARARGQLEARDGISLAKAQSEYEAALLGVKQLQMRREALKLAADALREAATTWNRDLSRAVSAQASQLMEWITGGVYRDVRLDPREGFRVRLLEPQSQQVVEQEQCSTGTQDQLYFAQRLALFAHVSNQTEPLPLFLDDHFVHYDQKRLEQALRCIAELGEQHQVFLFTCTDREQMFLQPLFADSNRHAIHRLADADGVRQVVAPL